MRNAKFKREVLTATGAAAMLMLSQSAHATTTVATIIGAYDATCNSACPGIMPAGVSHYATNSGSSADTPSLFILNPTSQSFTSVSLKLTGYQAAANGGTGANESSAGPADPAEHSRSHRLSIDLEWQLDHGWQCGRSIVQPQYVYL